MNFSKVSLKDSTIFKITKHHYTWENKTKHSTSLISNIQYTTYIQISNSYVKKNFFSGLNYNPIRFSNYNWLIYFLSFFLIYRFPFYFFLATYLLKKQSTVVHTVWTHKLKTKQQNPFNFIALSRKTKWHSSS